MPGSLNCFCEASDPNIRRKQHFIATNEGVGSKSVGEENKRRIVLKKRL